MSEDANIIRWTVENQKVRLENNENTIIEECHSYKNFKDFHGRAVVIHHRYTPVVNFAGKRLEIFYPSEDEEGGFSEAYIKVKVPSPSGRERQVRFHQLLAYMRHREKAFEAHVDHVNCDPYDNSWFNLELMSSSAHHSKDSRIIDHKFQLFQHGQNIAAMSDWKYVEILIQQFHDIDVWEVRRRIGKNNVKIKLNLAEFREKVTDESEHCGFAR
jgi:hypothetical protein